MTIFIPNKNYEITELYDTVATLLGNDSTTCRYDCRKIEIAKNLQQNIYNHYLDSNPQKPKYEVELSVTMMLACLGPRVNYNLKDNQVYVEQGFIVKEN